LSKAEPDDTLRAGIYEELRQRLIAGKIAPGIALSTRGIAQQRGVSQMPVRDALSRLAEDSPSPHLLGRWPPPAGVALVAGGYGRPRRRRAA
jgi:hypothetical protein